MPASARGGVLTIGNFDGVHVGHQRIVAAARRRADEAGVAAVAMTFEPPPVAVLRPDQAPRRIVPADVKCRLLRDAGADWVVVATAEPRLLRLEPGDFIDEVIVGRFAPRALVEGPDFSFGRRRRGNVTMLAEAGAAAGFEVHVAEPVSVELPGGARPVSSTLIRELVRDGRVEEAARCLGRDFALHGRVVGGQRVGRALEFPTANLDAGDQVIPGDGVYAGRAEVAGQRFVAAVSIGTKPTLHDAPGAPRVIEAFLLDAAGDYYDETMVLTFVRRVRGQERFESVEVLKAKIAEDVARVRNICG